MLFFVRAQHWWDYKLPPPLMLLFLLFPTPDHFSKLVQAFVALIVTIAMVCNSGYVLNEIYDVDEDAKSGRINTAAGSGPVYLWCIAVVCVFGSLSISLWAAGTAGFAVTLAALLFPVLYSVPPFRLKERQLLGVVADSAAAHVFPAAFCLLLLARVDAQPPTSLVIVVVTVWSFAVGLRGILTHQLLDEERDYIGGLRTVVHQYGRRVILLLVLRVIVPVELSTLFAILVFSHITKVFMIIVASYAIYESLKLVMGWKILLFERRERPYMPFLNGGFYEVWGPIGAAAEIASKSELLLPLPVVVGLLFHRRMIVEYRMIRALAVDFSKRYVRY